MSSYDVGAPPPRRRRGESSSGGVSPLIAASRPPVTTDSVPESQPLPAAAAPVPATELIATGPTALQDFETISPVRHAGPAGEGVASPVPTTGPVSQSAEVPLRKKTIAFPADLWRYAGTVHNATDDDEDEMYFQEFVWAAVRREIERREIKYNGGQPFDASSRLRRGRRRKDD